MGFWQSNILGGVIRWAVPILISGACLVLGFSPQEWVTNFIGEPLAWLIHPFFRIGIVIVGVMIFLGVLFWDRRKRKHTRISAWDAVDYLKDRSYWGGLYSEHPMAAVTAMIKLADCAKTGHVKFKGRPIHTADYEDIPSTYWETCGFDDGCYWRRGGDGGRTELKNISAGGAYRIYEGVRASKTEIRRISRPLYNLGRLIRFIGQLRRKD